MNCNYSPLSSRESKLEGASGGSVDPANWMSDFGHVPMPNLIVPGAHDSGAQNLDCFSTGPDWKQARNLLPLGCCVVKPWSEAQGCDVSDLLLMGCRYFDLRVGIDDRAAEGCEDSYRLCHGYFSRSTLADFLQDVREFLDEHPTEAVFLEVKKVMSFNDSVSMEEHDVLIAFIEEHLGGKHVFVDEPNLKRPLGDLVNEGRQVFLVYGPGGWGHPGESPVDNHRDTMLPGYCMRSKWPNLCDPGALCEYLRQEIQEQSASNHGKFLILQCVMTPGAVDIVKGLFCACLFGRSLRSLARLLEPDLREMLEGIPIDLLSHGAIVMLDWLDDQPGFIQWVINRNRSCHAPA